MEVVRAKRAIFVLAAVLSLATSTLAACCCSHHEIVAAPVETSCHGISHEQPDPSQSVDQTASGDKVETGCRCVVRQPGPSLATKSSPAADSSSDAPAGPFTFEVDRVLLADSTGPANYYFPIAHYNSHHGTRAPARAPPSL